MPTPVPRNINRSIFRRRLSPVWRLAALVASCLAVQAGSALGASSSECVFWAFGQDAQYQQELQIEAGADRRSFRIRERITPINPGFFKSMDPQTRDVCHLHLSCRLPDNASASVATQVEHKLLGSPGTWRPVKKYFNTASAVEILDAEGTPIDADCRIVDISTP
ncbi:hypothetical protein [Roseibium sediminicola]|uniref:Uncharacterized protein n=1 Tax=Roseibium sediminicola TaxID=2933272 RepID=A0ABT0GMP4_9HYPH|nr:hypothetical protein [Roseibium sp. CAU 1639]MCK7610684.1 hypothetical protein [Roseibium sp. CAU 1639]